jgi:hypothetical protein
MLLNREEEQIINSKAAIASFYYTGNQRTGIIDGIH